MQICVPERFVFENVIFILCFHKNTIMHILWYTLFFIASRNVLCSKKTNKRKYIYVCLYSYFLWLFTSLYSLYLMCTFADVPLAEHAVLFPGVCNVAPGAALALRRSSRLLLLSDFLEAERGTGVPAAALSAWPALKRHHHQRKRALKISGISAWNAC